MLMFKQVFIGDL